MSEAPLTALLVNQQTARRSRKVGRVHYDLSNDFFEAMLDPNMQYSCALFAEGDDLASAQLRKLDWICKRVRLQPDLRLLDIGCGFHRAWPRFADRSPQPVRAVADTDQKETKLDTAFHATLKCI